MAQGVLGLPVDRYVPAENFSRTPVLGRRFSKTVSNEIRTRYNLRFFPQNRFLQTIVKSSSSLELTVTVHTDVMAAGVISNGTTKGPSINYDY